jgi:hypothetical protein
MGSSHLRSLLTLAPSRQEACRMRHHLEIPSPIPRRVLPAFQQKIAERRQLARHGFALG